jgi:hypothetical protein
LPGPATHSDHTAAPTVGLARLLRDQPRSEEARRLLASVYDRFTEGFTTTDVRAAKALIDDLGKRTKR